MKKVLAVVVSILWLVLIVGIPALVWTGNAARFIPAQLLEPLAAIVGPDVAAGLGLDQTTPTPVSGEPIVAVDTATPLPTVEPTTPPPSPTPLPPPTATAEPTPTPAPESEETALPLPSFPVSIRGQADLRTGPGLDFDAVGVVDAGATVLVSAQDETGEWFQMDNGNWIPAAVLTSKPPVPILLPTPEVTPVPAAPETPVTPVAATPATPVVVRVNADANLRSGPGGTFDRVGGASFNSDVTVVGKFATDNWYLLDSGAWIFGELLESAPDVPEVNADGTLVGSPQAPAAPAAATPAPAAPPIAASGTTTLTVNTLANLRAAPNTTSAVTGAAQPGATISVAGKNAAGDWLKLESGSWIFAELVDNVPADLPFATEDAVPAAATPAAATPAEEATAAPAAETPAVTAPATDNATSSSAAVDANLRTGPGTTFTLSGSITAGTALKIIGRNDAGDWLKLDSGVWIFGELVNNSPANLPVVES